MADDITLNTMSGGSKVGADEISSVFYQRLKLIHGVDGTNSGDVSWGNGLPVLGLTEAAALGKLTNLEVWSPFGKNGDVDVGTETVWHAGGAWLSAPNSSAETIDIVSTDANDTSAGTGARTVKVFGLDASYAAQSETVTMNGTTDVPTSNTYLVIYKILIQTVGSGTTNAGTITATGDSFAAIHASMEAGYGVSTNASHVTRASGTGLLYTDWMSVEEAGGGSDVTLTLQMYDTANAPSWVTIHERHVDEGAKVDTFHHNPPLVIPEKTYVRMNATSDVANTVVTGGLGIVEST